MTDEHSQEQHSQEHGSVALSVPTALLPGNRPIEPSHLDIVKTYKSVGSDRPVTRGEIAISSTMVISGNRPIALSSLHVSDTLVIMGNRPVASNEAEGVAALMGYLD